MRQRVASLTERGVIQIVAATSPIALGMIQAFVSVRLAAPGSSRRPSGSRAIPEVDYVAVCTGPTDLLVGAVCRDNQHLLEVVTQRDPRGPRGDRDRHRGDPLRAQGLLPLLGGRAPRLSGAGARSASTRRAQLRPLAPVTPPPGWVPAPQR